MLCQMRFIVCTTVPIVLGVMYVHLAVCRVKVPISIHVLTCPYMSVLISVHLFTYRTCLC